MTKKSIKKKIIFLFLTTILGIESCYAAGLGFTNLESGGAGGGDVEIPYTAWADYPSGNSMYQFRYKKVIGTATNISMNAYNLDGDSVIPYSTKIDKNKYTFKSGTWIGINVTEVKSVSWKVYDFQYQEVQKKYTCTYTKQGGSYQCCKGSYTNKFAFGSKQSCNQYLCSVFTESGFMAGYGSCKSNLDTCYYGDSTRKTTKTVAYNESYTCPRTYPGNSSYKLTNSKKEEVQKTITNSNITTPMKNKAVNDVIKIARSSVQGTSGSVKYITNNSYPDDLKDIEYSIIEGGDPIREEENGPTENNGTVSGNIQKYYEILESKVCMNVKTSEVTYGRDCNTKNGEIQIKNSSIYDKYLKENVDFWHYFIPLNAKSDSEFTLDIVKNENNVFNITTCENFMKEHLEDYQNYIVPTGELGTFIGDYGRYSNKSLSTDLQKIKQGKGCNVSTKISFPISQEFYNEVDTNGEKKLKGFNFYYKPIDIENPFPNGLASTSIWSTWNKSTKKNPDISESFEEITYIATNINTNSVRQYNKDNPYTSWTNMYTTGISSFIENKDVVTRKVDKNSFYKLGCGPFNKNWEECKKT